MLARRVFTDRFGSLAVMGITRLLITVHERMVCASAFQFSCLNGVSAVVEHAKILSAATSLWTVASARKNACLNAMNFEIARHYQ